MKKFIIAVQDCFIKTNGVIRLPAFQSIGSKPFRYTQNTNLLL